MATKKAKKAKHRADGGADKRVAKAPAAARAKAKKSSRRAPPSGAAAGRNSGRAAASASADKVKTGRMAKPLGKAKPGGKARRVGKAKPVRNERPVGNARRGVKKAKPLAGRARPAAKKSKPSPKPPAVKKGVSAKPAAKKAPLAKPSVARKAPSAKPVAKKAKRATRVAAVGSSIRRGRAVTSGQPVVRRDAVGHLNPKYAADLMAESGRRDEGEEAFVSGHHSRDDLAENLGEEFVSTVTSGEDEGEDVLDQVVPEEGGGPFVESNAETEFADGIDPSNPKGAKREPFPTT